MNPPESGAGDLFERIHRGLDRFESGVLTVLLLTLIVLGLTQILLRNFAGVSLPWADGAMRAAVLWLAMIAGAMAAGRLRHIRIDVAEQWLSSALRLWIHRASMLGTALVCLALTWLSLAMVALEHDFGVVAFLNVPNWVVVFIIPVGFGLMAARFAAHAFVSELPTPAQPVASEPVDPDTRS